MSKQLSRAACFAIVIASMIGFTLVAGMFSSRLATDFLGPYIAYLLFQLIFFYIFRAIYKNKERSWAALITFIIFALIPTLLGIVTRYATPPANLIAPASAWAIFIFGWWIFFAARRNANKPTANEQ